MREWTLYPASIPDIPDTAVIEVTKLWDPSTALLILAAVTVLALGCSLLLRARSARHGCGMCGVRFGRNMPRFVVAQRAHLVNSVATVCCSPCYQRAMVP